MRILVLADIHSNLEAFRAVLTDAQTQGGFQGLWCLGDVVGYGPDPGPCIDLLREVDPVCVAGNHDWAAVGKITTLEFNAYAAAACEWTSQQLTSAQARYLHELSPVVQQESFTLVHGSLRDPIWEYLLSDEAAQATFARCQTPYCLVGHSHIPFTCEEGQGFARVGQGSTRLSLDDSRLIINPGSVGQPRDGDPRASYAVLDTDAGEVTHYRVAYDIPATQEKMRRASLPQPLIERLTQGW